MRNRIAALVVGIVLLLCSSLLATLWYVHPDSTLSSIQAALDFCAIGDTVLVAPGIYYESISWPLTDSIWLNSEMGNEMTIIDGSDTSRVVEISGISYAVLEGFTIQNGYTFQSYGAGVYCHDVSGEFVMDCSVIMNNAAVGSQGGGISCRTAYVVMSNTTIRNNTAHAGAGMCFEFADGIIENTAIVQNVANDSGGGVFCHYYSSPAFINCIISENSPTGVFCHYWTSPTFDSCTIAFNSGDGVQFNYLHDAYIHYCNIMGNGGFGIRNFLDSIWANAEYNWWGDATGPYHPDSNPGGQGDSVSDYVDFIPWLGAPVGVELPEDRNQISEISITAHPNPFSAGTSIKVLGTRKGESQDLCIYDVSGRMIRSFFLESSSLQLAAEVTWDGRDDVGKRVPPGVYFIMVGKACVGKVAKVR